MSERLDTQDVVEKKFFRALSGLPWPVSQPPGLAENETYITFQPVSGDVRTAGMEATRVRHLVQLHAFSHAEDGEHRRAFFAAIARLKDAGIRVYSWGPDSYEAETGIHHIACTCVWMQTPKETEEIINA